MRISELAKAGGVGVPTIKFYLRERLLPEGRLTSATQAQYDDSHLQRLRLIRALLGPGGLSVARAREVLNHLDHPPRQTHDLLGLAHATVTPTPPPDTDLTQVHALLREWGWHDAEQDCATHALLAAALDGARDAGLPMPPEVLARRAEQMLELASDEVAGVPWESPEDAVRYVVLGTVLVEPVLLALRRMAQQEASIRRFGRQLTSETIHR